MWVPDLGNTICAVIEFETQEEAQAACREINMANREDGKLRVALLKPGARIRRTLYRVYKGDEIEEMKALEMKQVSKVHVKLNKVLTPGIKSGIKSDSGHGSDGSNEASTASSEDENIAVATQVVTRRSWISKVYQHPRAASETSVIRQPIGPDSHSRGFASRHALKRRELLSR